MKGVGGEPGRKTNRPGHAWPLAEEGTGSAAWLVAPGLAMIAVTYGMARFAYGLFVPQMREAFDLSPSVLGLIGAGSYLGYCVAIVASLVFTSRVGPRFMAVAAGTVAVVGMATVAGAPAAWVLAAGILVAGSSTGLASPPMGEAVALSVPEGKQDRSNTLINSGTSVGVALSGPAALLVAEQWRSAWAAFTAIGLAVLVWNAFAMPRKLLGTPVDMDDESPPDGPADEAEDEAGNGGGAATPALSFGYLFGRRSVALFVAAGGMGFASAAYWTFSRDLVVQAGGLGETGSTLFWTVIGVSGLAGAGAGDLVRRFGLAKTFRCSLLAMAGASALLAAAPGVLGLSYLSAALFGSAYIMLTGVILVWSVAVFSERPSAGIGAGFLLIAVGQVVGSPVAGALAGETSLTVAFLAFSGATALTACVRPCLEGLRIR
ncbi:MFS transporter [soil metagenome]